MGLVNFDIKLIEGVTQQSPELSSPNQVQDMLNIYPSPAFGCVRRPPLTEELSFTQTYPDNSFFEVVTFSDNLSFVFIAFISALPDTVDIHIYRINDGQLNTWNAVPYLQSSNPRQDLRILVVADTIFLVNRTKIVLPKRVDIQKKPNVGLIYIKQARTEQNYYVYINNILVGHVKTLAPTTTTLIDTIDLADILVNGSIKPLITGLKNLTAELAANFPGEFSLDWQGNVIRIFRNDGGTFDLRSEDGFGDEALQSVYDEIQTIGDLNGLYRCFNNTVLKVIGSGDVKHTGFYMKFETNNNQDFGDGTWKQTYGWHSDWKTGFSANETLLLNDIDETTMPHRISYNGALVGINFNLSPINWESRPSGDDLSSPYPSFVSEFVAQEGLDIVVTRPATINNVFFYQNRLGLLSGESVILSRDDDYYNFWRMTATDIIDTDPIDVAASDDQVNILFYAVRFGQSLMLCSDKKQFVMTNRNALTPRTVKIDLVSTYLMNPDIKPQGIGAFLVFNIDRNNYAAIMQYLVDSENVSSIATDITSHVPRFIPNTVKCIAVGQDLDLFVIITEDNEIFVYKYLWDNNRLLQSAWSKWDFPRNIGNVKMQYAKFIKTDLYLIGDSTGGSNVDTLFKIDLRFPEDESIVCLDANGNMYSSSFRLQTMYLRDGNNTFLNGRLHILRCELFLGCSLINNVNALVLSNPSRFAYVYVMDGQLDTKRNFPVQLENIKADINIGNWTTTDNFKIHAINVTGNYVSKSTKV